MGADSPITCASCGQAWPAGAGFCGGCGQTLGAGSSKPTGTAGHGEHEAEVVELEPSERELKATSAPKAATSPSYRAPSAGLQSYRTPDDTSELSAYVDADHAVEALETRGLWVRVGDGGREIGWVDGRRLVPPAVLGVGPGAGMSMPHSIGAGGIVGAIAAIGIVIGAAVDWVEGASINSFDIPLFPLFDSSNFDEDPKVGYVLVVLTVVGLVCCFIRHAEWVRFAVGGVALVPVIAYVARIADGYEGTSVEVTDVLGAGVYVAGVSAIVLALSPLIDVWIAAARGPSPARAEPNGVTM